MPVLLQRHLCSTCGRCRAPLHLLPNTSAVCSSSRSALQASPVLSRPLPQVKVAHGKECSEIFTPFHGERKMTKEHLDDKSGFIYRSNCDSNNVKLTPGVASYIWGFFVFVFFVCLYTSLPSICSPVSFVNNGAVFP